MSVKRIFTLNEKFYMIDLWYSEYTLNEIGNIMNCSRSTLQRFYKSLGMKNLLRVRCLTETQCLERFESNIDRSYHPKGCWIWTGKCNRDGYGLCPRFRKGGKLVTGAHRISYTIYVGPIPNTRYGGLVLHSCDNPPCVNPDHLSLGDDQINAIQKFDRGRGAKVRIHRC